MQALCEGMDHCSNYLSMRIDLQCVHLLYMTQTHTHTHTPHTTPFASAFFFPRRPVWLYPPLVCPSLGPASQKRAVVVVVGRYSLRSLEIRVNSGNHFQLPSSDYFGAAAWHCEMGLGVRQSGQKKKKKKKSPPITALSCLLTAGMFWAAGQRAKGHGDNRVTYFSDKGLKNLFFWGVCGAEHKKTKKKKKKKVWKAIKASSKRRRGVSSEERGRIETVLCWALSSKTNQGSSSFCVVDWKRQDITYWWALVVQGETHASFKEIASRCFQPAFSDIK